MKGYGDPFLVSEELDLIVAALKKKGVKKVSAIVTDTSYFASNLYVDGRSQTDNPYDAPLSALAANFNTVAFKRTKKGAIVIAEKQTPITPLAEKLGKKYLKKRSKARVNLETEKNAERYFAEHCSLRICALAGSRLVRKSGQEKFQIRGNRIIGMKTAGHCLKSWKGCCFR